MAEENFNDNLLRMVAAEFHLLNALTASREMFGKGYFALGVAEKAAVDQTVFANVAANYQALTPEFLAGQKAPEPMGFRAPTEKAP
jgi:hypothetical protein